MCSLVVESMFSLYKALCSTSSMAKKMHDEIYIYIFIFFVFFFTLPQNIKRCSCKLESKDREQVVVVAHSCSPSTMKPEADCHGGGQPRLHSETG